MRTFSLIISPFTNLMTVPFGQVKVGIFPAGPIKIGSGGIAIKVSKILSHQLILFWFYSEYKSIVEMLRNVTCKMLKRIQYTSRNFYKSKVLVNLIFYSNFNFVLVANPAEKKILNGCKTILIIIAKKKANS